MVSLSNHDGALNASDTILNSKGFMTSKIPRSGASASAKNLYRLYMRFM